MPYEIEPGTIISVQDFMDSLVHYLMPPVTDYQNKITLIFQSGLRFNVLKEQVLGLGGGGGEDWVGRVGWTAIARNITVGYTIPVQNGSSTFVGRGPAPETRAERCIQVVDPADNTTFNGTDKHDFEAKMPIPGQLISVPDIEDFMITTGATMYTYKTLFVYSWNCSSYENIRNTWPVWQNPGGPGWTLRNQVQLQILGDPVPVTSGGLYQNIPDEQKIKEDQLISIYQIQTILSQMYMTNNNLGSETFHHLVCHHNCHGRCHCARW